MKESELRKYATCSACQKGIGHTGLPLFWRVTIERFGVNVHAARRQDGLAAHLGSPLLASIMGPDEEMTMPMMDAITLSLCETCALQSPPIAALTECGAEKDAPGERT